MTIYALWYGGYSYASGTIKDDLETFPSIVAAKRALLARHERGYGWRQHFEYVHKPASSEFTPCVEGSQMVLYFADPTDSHDPYPDRILSVGPRGGVKSEVC